MAVYGSIFALIYLTAGLIHLAEKLLLAHKGIILRLWGDFEGAEAAGFQDDPMSLGGHT